MSFAAAGLAGLFGGSPFIGRLVSLHGVEDLAEATLALYQGTALAGPYPTPLMRVLAPEVRLVPFRLISSPG